MAASCARQGGGGAEGTACIATAAGLPMSLERPCLPAQRTHKGDALNAARPHQQDPHLKDLGLAAVRHPAQVDAGHARPGARRLLAGRALRRRRGRGRGPW